MGGEVDYNSEGQTLGRGELERRYRAHDIFCPKIAKNWHGFNYWSVSCLARQRRGGSCYHDACKPGLERSGRK